MEAAAVNGQAAPQFERIRSVLEVAVNWGYSNAIQTLEQEVLKPISVRVDHISESIQVQQEAARPGNISVSCDLNKVVDEESMR